MKAKRGKKQDKPFLFGNEEWCNQHIQCNGSGWAVGKPVGSLGRTPMWSQKQLKGKNDKFYHGRQYKGW